MRFILLLFLIVSCGEKNAPIESNNTESEIAFDPAVSQMELIGDAARFNTTWVAYQKFITELENFDHSTAAAERLILAVDDMDVSLPEELNKQPVRSRLKVLETRVKSYHALLTHNSYEVSTQQDRYDQLITALDGLKIQMMEVFLLKKAEESILENLEDNLNDLEENNDALEGI
ncbi:MAG: hypothetical protein ACSHWW_01610 [Nonlabens sp.]|uniref:hypothetical protein n=1 Tax=Nonlabens sp. TaxID=1888209 RepID=UPI003EF1996E